MVGEMNPLNNLHYGSEEQYICANHDEVAYWAENHGYHVWEVKSAQNRFQVFVDLFDECTDGEDFIDHMDALWRISQWSIHYMAIAQ